MKQWLATFLRPLDKGVRFVLGPGAGLKDLFTLVNLFGGILSLYFSMKQEIGYASAAVMLGYLGDVLDGPVARLTHRQNRFGSELDTIADHVAQCIAPAFVVFLAFRGMSEALGLGLAALMVVTGSVRHARGAAQRFEFDLAWNGMPRPVAAFLVLAYVNSLARGVLPFGGWVGVGLVVVVSVLNLVSLPFMNHHGRKLQPAVKAAVWFGFLLAITLAVVEPRFFWDVLLFMIVVYSLASWMPMSAEERRGFFAAAARWRAHLDQD
ncbi:MAG: CDP-alcohol phosphatidyltransferase family protein [Deltaproteobacteria bacterium]|nr:CDP-alcohol phosphatidyltransferase family protein [Deltaproteobacteria bacterium]